ncbi:MAG: MBL fold metallo-hydrolase [Bacilli bacterium]|nr:MBL fold metallo-hydrolase [Bacilli bacterium]
MMLSFLNLASGSKGNATLIYSKSTLLLVDMGITKRLLVKGLKTLGKSMSDIQGVFITHEHSDHIKGIAYVKSLDIYSSENTLQTPSKIIYPYESIEVGDIIISALSVSHDAANPLGYIFENGDTKLVYITDTGYISDENIALISGANYYILESNHDLDMLMHSHRPISLKQRIHSDHGHLSNTDSALYLTRCVDENVKAIYLAHLSEECNTPEKAIETHHHIYYKETNEILSKAPLFCLKQHEMSKGGDDDED